MTAPPIVIGHAQTMCRTCPWPLHFAMLLDVERYAATGMPYVLDAQTAGIPLALRVHMRQHEEDQ